MRNDLSKDYFDCPHCGIKNVIYDTQSSNHEQIVHKTGEGRSDWIAYDWAHYIVK